MGEQIITNGFNISPTSVFGFLVVILVFTVGSLGVFIRSIYKDWKETLKEEKRLDVEKDKAMALKNESLQREYIDVLTNVVQGNTESNKALVDELHNHRRTASEIAERTMQANMKIQDKLTEINIKLDNQAKVA